MITIDPMISRVIGMSAIKCSDIDLLHFFQKKQFFWGYSSYQSTVAVVQFLL